MGWENQGRQYHMWFGHGTSPNGASEITPPPSDGLFAPRSIGQRIDYAAASVVGQIPRDERKRWESSSPGHTGRERLQTAIAAWYGASGLGRNIFRERLLDPYTSDEAVDWLRSAARGIVEAPRMKNSGPPERILPPQSRRSGSNGGRATSPTPTGEPFPQRPTERFRTL